MNSYDVLILSKDEGLIELLGEAFDASLTVGACTPEEFGRIKLQRSPKYVFLDLRETADAVQTAQAIRRAHGKSHMVVIGEPAGSRAVIELMREGVEDFLSVPVKPEELSELLIRIRERAALDPGSAAGADARPEGRITLFLAPKGGCGVTLLTANIGVAIARQAPDQTLCMELSPQCGDIATYLDVVPESTLRDLVDRLDQADENYLNGLVRRHKSGLHILSGPGPEQEPLQSRHLIALKAVLRMLSRRYQHILLDAGPADPGLLQTCYSNASEILLVGNLEIPTLKGMVSQFNRLVKLGIDPTTIRIILNRSNAKHQVSLKEFERSIQHPVSMLLPNDYPLCVDSVNQGKSLEELDPKAEITKKVEALAEDVKNGSNQASETPKTPHSPSFKQKLSHLFAGTGKGT